MRIYLLSALRIANAEVLPFDWSATCDEFLATIGRYEKASQGMADLSAAREATENLKAALGRLGNDDPAYTMPPLPTLAVAAELSDLPEAHRRPAQVA
jgi:N-acetylated-alpha-linked acidic dipeptidase